MSLASRACQHRLSCQAGVGLGHGRKPRQGSRDARRSFRKRKPSSRLRQIAHRRPLVASASANAGFREASARGEAPRNPPICKSNGFALQRKPTGGRITLNAASIWGISVYHILIGGHEMSLEWRSIYEKSGV